MSTRRPAGGAALVLALALAFLTFLFATFAPSARADEEATASERARVRAFLGQWLATWRAQDIEAYLALYAADARVGQRDRAAHAEHKRRVFARAENPSIDIGDVEIVADTSTGVRLLRARFDQSYASPSLTDFGRKELELRDFGSQLLIANETWTASRGSIEVPLGSEPAEPGEAEPPTEPGTPLAPIELPPDDELLTSEPLLPPPPDTSRVPGLPPMKTEDGRHVIEEIVASVNGRILTRSMYVDRIGWYEETLLSEDPPDLEERLGTLAAETLDTTVDRWVILQEAMHGADVERFWRDWLADFRRQVGAADMAELDQLLAEQGTSVEKLKEQVVETELPMMYLQQELAGRLTFSEAELREHFEKNKASYQPPITVSFRQILVPVGAGDDSEKAAAIARTILEELATGRPWCELNTIYGQAGSSCNELPDIPLTDLVPELRESASGLPLGAVSRPVRTRQGYHIIEVTKRVGAEPVAYEAVRDRVLQELRSEIFEVELAKLIDDLRSAAIIEVNERYESLYDASTSEASEASDSSDSSDSSEPSAPLAPATSSVPGSPGAPSAPSASAGQGS